MKAACSNCGARHVLPEAQLSGHPRVQFRCARCGKSTVVEMADRSDETRIFSPLPQFARNTGGPRLTRGILDEENTLRLPQGRSIALSVIAGPSRGIVYPVRQPRVVLGRAGSDLPVEDPEVSRKHCVIEIKDDVVRLRDLESTNGTFLGDERVRNAELKHLSEFRIGSSVILVSVTSRLSPER